MDNDKDKSDDQPGTDQPSPTKEDLALDKTEPNEDSNHVKTVPRTAEEDLALNRLELNEDSNQVRQVKRESSQAENLTLDKTKPNEDRNQVKTEQVPEAAAYSNDKTTNTNVNDEMAFNTSLHAAERHYYYFWKDYSPFSQWYRSEFTIDDNKFRCAEQYMMYTKAVLLHDDAMAKKILHCKDPSTMKHLGREVIQFSSDLWDNNCLHVVKEGNRAKFSQHQQLKEELYSTYPRVLVEASPYDKKWGIGLDKKQQSAWNEVTWEGLNLLGFILTELRDEMMCEDGIITADYKKTYFKDLEAKLTEFTKNLKGQDYFVNEKRMAKQKRYSDKKYDRVNYDGYKNDESIKPDKEQEKSRSNRGMDAVERDRSGSKSPKAWIHEHEPTLVTESEPTLVTESEPTLVTEWDLPKDTNQGLSARNEKKEKFSSGSLNPWMGEGWSAISYTSDKDDSNGKKEKFSSGSQNPWMGEGWSAISYTSDKGDSPVVKKSNELEEDVKSSNAAKEFSDDDGEN